jgi:hypothetical protein
MRFGLALLVFFCSTAGYAQQAGPPPRRDTPDFLFGRPDGSVGVRGGWLFARAGSDWFDFVSDQLTLDRRDFNAPGIAADVSVFLRPRIDAVVGMEYNAASTPSEYRDFVDNNRLPITQETELRHVALTGSLKFALTERGRQVGNFAWVPHSVVPYVGGGGGALWYRLEQVGDFVDFVDRSVFTDVFRSEGWAPTGHVFGGVDVKLTRRLFVTFDGRYIWAKPSLGREFIDFDPIDLSGFRTSAGVNLVF